MQQEPRSVSNRRTGRGGPWSRLPLKSKGFVIVLIPLIPLLATMAIAYQGQADDVELDRVIKETREQREWGDELLATLLNAETGVRGFMLAEDPGFLEPYLSAKAVLPRVLGQLRSQLSSEEGSRMQRIAVLSRSAMTLLGELRANEAAEETSEESSDEDLQNQLLMDSKTQVDELRSEIQGLLTDIDDRLEDANAARTRAQNEARFRILLGGGLGVIGGVIGMLILTNGIVKRVKTAAVNASRLPHRERLEDMSLDGDEVAELARALVETRELLDQQEQRQSRSALALTEASEEAQRANRAKSEFLSRMSHELRTPLNAILGFGQLLEMDGLKADQKESVEHILKGGRHLLSLIDEVLDISRIESGKLQLSVEDVNVLEVIAEAIDLVRPMAAQREIHVSCDEGSEEVTVLADRQRLKQVVLNLLTNAVKYNREKGLITISCSVEVDSVTIAVTDTGLGIPAASLDRLFVPFDRLDADQSIEGTGLGLSLSCNLMRSMNGSIAVDSIEEEGTTFTLRLPPGEPPAQKLDLVAEAAARPELDSGEGRRILYVEDNLANLRLVERILETRPGITLIPAMQGSTALDLAVQHQPDLILLDLHLPDINGDEVLVRLRGNERTVDIPVIILSADATSSQKSRLARLGAKTFLSKPIHIASFFEALDEALTVKAGLNG